MKEAIKIIHSNYIVSGLERFFSERITERITDPHLYDEANRTFSFIIEYTDIKKGISGNKFFMCLAFKKMMEKMYNEFHHFFFDEVDGDTFRFRITIDRKELDNTVRVIAASINTVKRKIIHSIIKDTDHLKRDLRNGKVPSLDFFCSENELCPEFIFIGNIVDCFSLRSVHINRYYLVLRNTIKRQFPELMTEQLEMTFSKILYL